MRYAELVLDPGPGGFHPADREIMETPDLERVAIQHFNQLDDGTIVFLYRLRGEAEVATDILDQHDDVLASSISEDEGDVHAYVHVDPNETVETVFRLPQEHSLVVETPIECLPGGALRAAVLGEQATLTEALGSVPTAFDVELETIRDYDPGQRELYATLTERQQEILATAIAVGYYDVPRTGTYEDVAAELDVEPVTVGEHLRKIEARILREIAPRQG